MSEFDYRTVRVGSVSVGDLLAFDSFVAQLPDRARDIVLRKIAFEVSEGTPAAARAAAKAALEGAEHDLKKLRDEKKKLEGRVGDVEKRAEKVDEAEARAARAERLASKIDTQLTALRGQYAEREARHALELQEAEVRGYQRGREEARNAA